MKWYQNYKERKREAFQAYRVRRADEDASAHLLELEDKLERLYIKAKERKSHDRFNDFLDFTDYLDSKEKLEYSVKAELHFTLCQSLKQFDRQYKYYDPRRDNRKLLPEPPVAYVKVTTDKANKIHYEYNEDFSKYRVLVNGEVEVKQFVSDDDGWRDNTDKYADKRVSVEELRAWREANPWPEHWGRRHVKPKNPQRDYLANP